MYRSGVSESPFDFAAFAYVGRNARERAEAAATVFGGCCPASVRVGTAESSFLIASPAAALQCGKAWILGDFYGAPPRSADPALLVRGGWGRYVAVELGEALTVFRDPSGAVPVWHLADDELAIFASTVTPSFARAAGFDLAIDDGALLHALVHPAATAHLCFLSGASRLAPGEAGQWCEGVLDRTTIWSPASIAGETPSCSAEEAGARLRDLTLEAVSTVAQGSAHILVELSGGLDSSIVTAALVEAGFGARATALNLASRQAAVDERRYACAVAERTGIALREIWLDADMIDLTDLERLPQLPEPLNFALDLAHNATLESEVGATGADLVVTGQGGDAIFYQMATALVGVDLVLAKGWAALFSEGAWAAAHRSRKSLWTIAGLTLRDRLIGLAPPAFPPTVLTEAARHAIDPARLNHPWCRDTSYLPPGKRLQLDALANCQLFVGPTLGGGTRRQRHPLLAQPLVEACLRLPAWQLADGPLDRGLARRAFAEWLPDIVARRRGKGEAAGHYNRAAVANLPTLRRLLLDGYLIERGLLDRVDLDALLDDSALLWREDYRLLLVMVSLELWARWWHAELGCGRPRLGKRRR